MSCCVLLYRVIPDDQKLQKNSLEKRILVKENDSPGGVFHFMNETNVFTSVTVAFVVELDL